MRWWTALLRRLTVAIIAATAVVNWIDPCAPSGALRETRTDHRAKYCKPGGAESISNSREVDAAQLAGVHGAYKNLPLSFEYSQREEGAPVRFIARGYCYDLAITSTEMQLNFNNSPPLTGGATSAPSALRMRLLGANLKASAVGLDEANYKTSYFIGNDPKAWRANVSAYSRVKCRDVYPGVDLVYYGTKNQPEYDFILAPEASHRIIRMRFEGAERVSVNRIGDLVLSTASGAVIHRKPMAYQQEDGARRLVTARYRVVNGCEATFEIGAYDSAQSLIIDPLLSYATYFGSPSGGDWINAVAFDKTGSAYILGNAATSAIPTTPGALQTVNHGRACFIAKLNPSGTAVQYATFLGGANSEDGLGIAVDDGGNAYATGWTSSTDFPTTTNAFQTLPPGEFRHPFVAKLNATGTGLVYSTYLGGKDETAAGTGVAINATGQATIIGYTNSRRFPTTSNALQPENGGDFDAFVARLNNEGSALIYATYLGGGSSDMGRAVALDLDGNAYVTGDGYSVDFPTTRKAYQRLSNGSSTSFIAKVNAAGERLIYSTYLSESSIASGVAVDAAGNAYVTGYVLLPTLPTTPGVFQPVSGGGFDAFVMKLNTAGSELVYSTFLGGSGTDSASAIAVDSLGQAYVTGSTNSVDFPVVNALQTRKRGGPLFKSTDGGDSWDDIPAVSTSISSVVVDPKTTTTLYGSTYDAIIKSTDGGATWSSLASGVSGSLVIDPLRPTMLYAFNGQRFFRSVDAGMHWERSDPPLASLFGISSLVIDPTMPDILYLSTRQVVVPNAASAGLLDVQPPVSVFKSTDSGASWNPIRFDEPVFGVSSLAIDPQTTSIIYACTEAFNVGLLKSTNSGTTWFKPAMGRTFFVRQLVVDPSNSTTLYATTFEGILDALFSSADGGASWSRTPFPRLSSARLTIDPRHPSTLYAGALDGLYRTTDGSVTWDKVLNTRFSGPIALDPKQTSTIYLPTAALNDMFIAKLNAAGSALSYSTYLGGFEQDYGNSIAVDAYGNAYAAGSSVSANFPVTPGAYQTHGATDVTGTIVRIADPIALRITGVELKGKKLLVSGQGFHPGSVITLNGADLETQNDGSTPAVLLIARRGGKQIAPGKTVAIRVRNPDGQSSNEVAFTRSPN